MPALTTTSTTAEERIAALEKALASERVALAAERRQVERLTAERDLLRASHERLRVELELLRRRIFVAKAERIDTRQLELEFATKLAELDKLGGKPDESDDEGDDGKTGAKGPKKKPTGRRDLRQVPLEEERVEILDPLFERLVAEGKAERIGHEESCKLAWKRGGVRRLIVARVKDERLRLLLAGGLGAHAVGSVLMEQVSGRV